MTDISAVAKSVNIECVAGHRLRTLHCVSAVRCVYVRSTPLNLKNAAVTLKYVQYLEVLEELPFIAFSTCTGMYEIMSTHALLAAATNFAGGESINRSLSLISYRHFHDVLV
jgi:hypothetical protein